MRRLTHQHSLATALRGAIALLACLCAASSALATPIELGNFHLLNATQPLSFTNNGGTSATLQALSVPVVFNFTAQSGLSTVDRTATLTINPPPSFLPAIVAGSLLDQPVHPTNFSIIENATGKILLSMLATNGELVGISGAQNASVSGASTSVFSSDYATFSAPFTQSFNLGLATLSAPLSIGPGGFLNSFTSNLNGQFTVDSAGFIPVPEPTSAALFGIGVMAIAARGLRKKQRLAALA
jgi:PEP-CTERM motif